MLGKILSILKRPKTTDTGIAAERRFGQKDGIEELCRQLVRMKGPVSVWRMHFTGLERAKQRIGSSGEALDSFVYIVADKVISANLGPDDLFARNEKGEYLIVFDRTPDAVARERATIISAQIRQRIFSSGQVMEEVDIERRAITAARTDFQGMTPNELMAGLMGEMGRAPISAGKEDRSAATRVLH